jgi:hypothetical protein
MNLKPNLWTLLFLLAAAALAYQYFTPSVQEDTPTTPPTEEGEVLGTFLLTEQEQTKLFSISLYKLTANTQRTEYVRYANTLKTLLKDVDINGITNVDVQHFKLDVASLRSLMQVNENNGDNEMYAILVVKQEGDKKVIDLVFSDKNPRSEDFATTARVFDFSTPCPTLCDE